MNQGVKNFINDLQRRSKLRHQGVDFTKMEKFMKPKEVKEKKPTPDTPVVITRPPATYSNTTPYGIAAELHK